MRSYELFGKDLKNGDVTCLGMRNITGLRKFMSAARYTYSWNIAAKIPGRARWDSGLFTNQILKIFKSRTKCIISKTKTFQVASALNF